MVEQELERMAVQITCEGLAEAYGRSERWWSRVGRPALLEAGVVRQIGGIIYGRYDRISDWLACEDA